MNKIIYTIVLSSVLNLLTVSLPAKAETLDRCLQRAEARRHTAISQARLAYRTRVASCQTMPSPDRAEQCVRSARATFERDSQAARARYAEDVRACQRMI